MKIIEVNLDKILGAIIIAALIGAFTWMWDINGRIATLESPEALSARMKTLEDLIFPLAVEHEVRKRLGLEGNEVEESDGYIIDEAIAPTMWIPPNTAVRPDSKVLEAAEDDVRSMIEQRPLDESRKRRGRPIELKKSKNKEK